ncbi:MAG: electron transfer flavoprotein subunit beta/FixA family protein [Candidatus Bathyarchaeia archaeon]
MNIIVCVKQVPATTEVMIDSETGTLIREGVESTVNPFDMYAIEEAVRLKERYEGIVMAISMGPPQAEASLREALAMGCDRAILLTDRTFAGADTLATAYTLACAIRKISEYDLIICGLKTTDGDTGQVGPGLAEELGIPHVSYVRKILDVKENAISLERSLDDIYEEVEAPLPCLITVTKEINEPRLPSFRLKLMARRAPITIWNAKHLAGDLGRFGLEGSPTRVVRVFHPPPRAGGELVTGDPEMQVERLIQRLKEWRIL